MNTRNESGGPETQSRQTASGTAKKDRKGVWGRGCPEGDTALLGGTQRMTPSLLTEWRATHILALGDKVPASTTL